MTYPASFRVTVTFVKAVTFDDSWKVCSHLTVQASESPCHHFEAYNYLDLCQKCWSFSKCRVL